MKKFTPAEFDQMLKDVYESGGSPDLVYLTPECAYRYGVIGPWRYRWLKLRQKLRLSLGTLKRSVISGVRSVLPTRGSKKTEQ